MVSTQLHDTLGINASKLTATEATTTATTVAAITAAAATAAIPNHLCKARINVLLRLLENTNEVASLLSI
jgi:hypothetical protein